MTKEYKGNVIDYTHDGRGVIKTKDKPAFVKGALKNETILFAVDKEKKNFMEGHSENIIVKSNSRQLPPCPYYNYCGGCHIQHMDNVEEQYFKRESVYNTLKKHLGHKIIVNPTVQLQNTYYYRNKSVFPVRLEDGEVTIGLFQSRNNKVVDIDHCMIQKKSHNDVLTTLRQLIVKYDISIYDTKKNTGLLRHIIIRSNHNSDQIEVIFVTNGKKNVFNPLIQSLTACHPNIVSIVQNINTKKTNLVTGLKSNVLCGSGYITDELLGLNFKIKHQSFYQVNHKITEKMYQDAINQANIKPTDTVLDAYCGIGTIGQLASQYAHHVIGVEVIESAIADARENSELNNIDNTEYYLGKAETVMKELVQNNEKIDVVFIDPPRKGCNQDFLEALLTIKPERIVYISCNPATLGRDLNLLSEKYHIGEVTPYNMFSETYHVESVVTLVKR